MKARFEKFADIRGFTLMELMIVLVIISILMGGVFKMMSIAEQKRNISQTTARIQKVENAISGFYAAYGTYPPVELHGKTNPFGSHSSDFGSGNNNVDGSTLNPKACRMACRAQPVAFEYPYPQETDEVVNTLFRSIGIMGANGVYQNAASIPSYSWSDVQMFKFGLMSFLLPRVQVVGAPNVNAGFSENHPIQGFYQSKQWKSNNKTSNVGGSGANANLTRGLHAQRLAENREAAKWIPNLEGLVSGHGPTVFNTSLGGGGYMSDQDLDGHLRARIQQSDEPIGVTHPFRGPYSKGSGSETVLYCSTIKDAWHQDLYYYSAPPYQSYRLWSAGPDKKTFPPWVPLESLSSSDRKKVAGWLEDDIVGFAK